MNIMSVRLMAPLRERRFRLLWIGMTVSLVGDGMMLVAIAIAVFKISNAPTALGVTMMAIAIPQLVFLLIGGAVSDRFDRRKVMIGSDLARGVAVGALALLASADSLVLWHLVVLGGLYGAGSAFFAPAFESVVPDLVPQSLLAQANALDQFVRPAASRLIGPALGGAVIAAIGVGGAFYFDAATFVFSVVCLVAMGAVEVPKDEAGEGQEVPSIWGEIGEGFRFVRSRSWLWGTLAAATLAYLVFLGPAEVLLPYVVKNELHGSAASLGLIFSAGGLGAIAAAAVMAQRGVPRRNMTFMYVVWTLSTLMVAVYGIATARWELALACFVFNAMETAGLVVWLTTKQLLVPSELLGRVSSLDWAISIGLMPVSYALVGPVSHVLGVKTTLVVAGVLGSAITLAFLFIPGVRSAEGLVSSLSETEDLVPTGPTALGSTVMPPHDRSPIPSGH
jgi:DHA3 family tetracycline resistance protein-like MFS transporter